MAKSAYERNEKLFSIFFYAGNVIISIFKMGQMSTQIHYTSSFIKIEVFDKTQVKEKEVVKKTKKKTHFSDTKTHISIQKRNNKKNRKGNGKQLPFFIVFVANVS